MLKVERDGKIAVLISGNHGLGWFTENQDFPQIMFHPALVKLVEEDRRHEIDKELVSKILKTDKYLCVLGASVLEIEWVKKGRKFRIHEYDGLEEIIYENEDTWFMA